LARIRFGSRSKKGSYGISFGKGGTRVSSSVRIAKGVSVGFSKKIGGSKRKKKTATTPKSTSAPRKSHVSSKETSPNWNDCILEQLIQVRALHDQGFEITDEENETIKSILRQDPIDGTKIKQNRRNENTYNYVLTVLERQRQEQRSSKASERSFLTKEAILSNVEKMSFFATKFSEGDWSKLTHRELQNRFIMYCSLFVLNLLFIIGSFAEPITLLVFLPLDYFLFRNVRLTSKEMKNRKTVNQSLDD